jgi:acetyl esterase/lipase
MLKARPLRRVLVLLVTFLLASIGPLAAAGQEATPTASPTQPGPPATGPGSQNYAFAGAKIKRYGQEPGGFWIYVPTTDADGATPAAAGPFPVILYLSGCCGAGDYPTPEEVQPWLTHLTRQGYVIVAPVYNANRVIDESKSLLQDALAELSNPGHAAVDLEQFGVIGFSYAGVPAVVYASSAQTADLPAPDAVFITAPCEGGFCQTLPETPASRKG